MTVRLHRPRETAPLTNGYTPLNSRNGHHAPRRRARARPIWSRRRLALTGAVEGVSRRSLLVVPANRARSSTTGSPALRRGSRTRSNALLLITMIFGASLANSSNQCWHFRRERFAVGGVPL